MKLASPMPIRPYHGRRLNVRKYQLYAFLHPEYAMLRHLRAVLAVNEIIFFIRFRYGMRLRCGGRQTSSCFSLIDWVAGQNAGIRFLAVKITIFCVLWRILWLLNQYACRFCNLYGDALGLLELNKCRFKGV